MNKKPITTKKNQTKSAKTPFYKQRWVIVVAVLILITAGWFIFKQSRFEHNRQEAKSKTEQVINALTVLPGQSVGMEIKDAGCGTGNIKFGKRTVCNYYGERVLRASGNIIDGKKTLDKKMIEMGYERYTVTLASFVFEELLNNNDGTHLSYLNSKGDNIEIFAYNNKTNPQDAIIQQNIESYHLKDGEYIYGVVVKPVYKIVDSF